MPSWRHDIQHNDSQPNGAQAKRTLSRKVKTDGHRVAVLLIMLCVIMPSVVMLNVVAQASSV